MWTWWKSYVGLLKPISWTMIFHQMWSNKRCRLIFASFSTISSPLSLKYLYWPNMYTENLITSRKYFLDHLYPNQTNSATTKKQKILQRWWEQYGLSSSDYINLTFDRRLQKRLRLIHTFNGYPSLYSIVYMLLFHGCFYPWFNLLFLTPMCYAYFSVKLFWWIFHYFYIHQEELHLI